VLTLRGQPGIKHRLIDHLAGGVVAQLCRLAGEDAYDIPAIRVCKQSDNVSRGGSKHTGCLRRYQRMPRISDEEGAVAGQQCASDKVLRCSLIKITLPGAYGSIELRRLVAVAEAYTRQVDCIKRPRVLLPVGLDGLRRGDPIPQHGRY